LKLADVVGVRHLKEAAPVGIDGIEVPLVVVP
jgi:hypothetical protein